MNWRGAGRAIHVGFGESPWPATAFWLGMWAYLCVQVIW